MWIQDPNYSPTVCFAYYWNCDSYTDNTSCVDSSTSAAFTQQVIFGNPTCFPSDSTSPVTGYSVSETAWTLSVTSYTFDTYTDSSLTTNAQLMSTVPVISLPTALWSNTEAMLNARNFTCNAQTGKTWETQSCVRTGPCSEINVYMPSLLFTTIMDVRIYPSEYLLDDFTSNTCQALISTTAESVIGLGQPFFRTYNIKLNYQTAEISIYTPNKQATSPVTDSWSSIGSPISQVETLYNYAETYYGPLYVGTALQSPSTDNYMMYSTQDSMTYIPVTGGAPQGWYDPANSTSAVQVDSTAVSFVTVEWDGTYTTYNDTVCTNSAQTASTLSSCVSDLTFAAVSALTYGEGSTFKGILGLGLPDGTNTNFVLEWAMQNYQQPVAIIGMGFDASNSYL
jgi:hypothetical protein